MFYANYVKLCNSIGKSPSAVAEEIGIERSTVTRWKQGKSQTDANVQKVASYFGVSVDDLISEQKEKSPAPEGAELDAETMELLEAWNSGDEAKEFLLSAARMIKARRLDK